MTSIEILEKVFDNRCNSYKGAILSVALERRAEALHVLRGVMRFTDSAPIDESRLDYGAMILLRKYFKCKEALGVIKALVAGTSPPGLETSPVQFKFERVEWRMYENYVNPVGSDRISDWPAEEFLLRSTGSSWPEPSMPQAKSALPLAVSPSNAIDAWIGTKQHRHNIQRGIVVELPDFRARISRVRFEEGVVRVSTESQPDFDDTLVAKAALDGREVSVERTAGAGDFLVRFTGSFSDFHFFLLNEEDDTMIDWARVYLSWTDLPPQIEFASTSRQLERLISNGESKELEFKKERGNGFTLLQSIVAFANTEGGLTLLGVDDDAAVVGTDPDADMDRIREWIDRRCDPPVDVAHEVTEINGKRVLLIHVPKGIDVPYVHRDNNGVYVRRGSTDRIASRSELQSLVRGR